MKQLLLVRHGATTGTARRAFPVDEPLAAEASVAAAQLRLPTTSTALASPATRALQTATAAGLTARQEPRLAECDFGSWAGRTLAEVHEHDPDGAGAWMLDADAAPHGGESLTVFSARVAGWLAEQANGDDDVVAVTHGGVIKACVANALGAPTTAFWRIDVDPLSLTELRLDDGAWSVHRLNWSPV